MYYTREKLQLIYMGMTYQVLGDQKVIESPQMILPTQSMVTGIFPVADGWKAKRDRVHTDPIVRFLQDRKANI